MRMDVMQRAVAQSLDLLLVSGAHRATKYLGPKEVVKLTRRLQNRRVPPKNQNLDIYLTIGRPNYAERQFVKDCVRADVKFPVQKVQLQFPPKRR